ncbi:DUF2332 domain-containing protein [Micromonospora sp. WMMD882]|uniref:DUF2332 domain-containing protein n=1 Tax=Micromonospora sp. WMMD882 TaxID=3015151 RepID=UPI00248C50A0|nr:DUF2332 domain-containing protein [Micromonospora sp. WMMD882]WBB78795.1 DUF2332 domain-containing protein [Micromonospora sp. WMMD882]
MSMDQVAQDLDEEADACAQMAADGYADLLRRAAADIRAGGPCGTLLKEYADTPTTGVLPLRLLGGVHALVLAGRAPELARYYPSAGGTCRPGDEDARWAAFRAVVDAESATLRGWLRRPPQTNEVGRASLLIAGLLHAVTELGDLPVRLVELGASAGLNLRADRFRVESPGFAWGPVDSPVRLPDAWRGAPPDWLRAAGAAYPELTVVERLGCDPRPLDPTDPDGALTLRAYVWPEHTERAARLAGALEVAGQVPATVVTAGAADFLAGIRPTPGTLTVVWHSVVQQYVPAQEWARVDAELERLAGAEAPVAYLAYEPYPDRDPTRSPRCRLLARLGDGPTRRLAEGHPHGLPAWLP